MSSAEDFKGLYIVVKKATDALEENRQQLRVGWDSCKIPQNFDLMN